MLEPTKTMDQFDSKEKEMISKYRKKNKEQHTAHPPLVHGKEVDLTSNQTA